MSTVSLESSSNTLSDVQNNHDHRNLPIQQVGIRSLRYPIQIADKADTPQSTVATFSLSVDLPASAKGTHMSRFVEVLNEHGPQISASTIPSLLGEIRQKLQAQSAFIDVSFPFFIEKTAPVSGSPGMVDYEARFLAQASTEGPSVQTIVTVPVTTLCPCSKTISERGAHNQRGYATLAVETSAPVWIEDLITLVEQSASSEMYSLLKRTDEKEVTERAYDNPVFVEDLVRNIALRCKAHSTITWYRIEVENHESIHTHNAFAIIESSPKTTGL